MNRTTNTVLVNIRAGSRKPSTYSKTRSFLSRCQVHSPRNVLGQRGVSSGPDADPNIALPEKIRHRNLLRDCSHLFSPPSPLASQVWRQRLQAAAENLAEAAVHLSSTRPIRIGVVGRRDVGTMELIEGILDDPMAKPVSEAVQTLRRTGYGQGPLVRIGFGEQSAAADHRTQIPHPWLQENNVEFVGIVDPSDDDACASSLYACDALVFVTDDTTLAAHSRYGSRLQTDDTLRLLGQFAAKRGTKVFVNQSGSHVVEAQTIVNGLQVAIGQEAVSLLMENEAATIFHASTSLAIQANDSLRLALNNSAPTAPSASVWDHFSSLYSSSGLAEVRSSIAEFARPPPSDDRDGKAIAGHIIPQKGDLDSRVESIAMSTSGFVLRRAIDQALFVIWRDIEYAQQAQGAANVLESCVEREREQLDDSIFGPRETEGTGQNSSLHLRAGDRSRTVDGASKDAWGLMEKTFSSRLPWWKIVWKVDDVRAETEAAIEGAFGRDLEQNLMLETGKLMSVAMRLQRQTKALFQELETSCPDEVPQDMRDPFRSPVLLNELRKYSIDGIDAKLRADLLTQPILRRRKQLLLPGGPVDVLCRRAQRSVLSSVGFTGFSGLVTITGGIASTSLGESLPSALSLLAMQPSTAGATFALASLLSAWHLQSRWTRAKKKFWKDWEFVADGLDNDLKANLYETYDGLIATQSIEAVRGLRSLVKGYLIELDIAQQESSQILAALHPRERQ